MDSQQQTANAVMASLWPENMLDGLSVPIWLGKHVKHDHCSVWAIYAQAVLNSTRDQLANEPEDLSFICYAHLDQ